MVRNYGVDMRMAVGEYGVTVHIREVAGSNLPTPTSEPFLSRWFPQLETKAPPVEFTRGAFHYVSISVMPTLRSTPQYRKAEKGGQSLLVIHDYR